jgi:2'-5' RNA ligase
MLRTGSIKYDHIAFLGRDKDRYVTAAANEFDDAQRLFDEAVQILAGHFERLSWDEYKAHLTIWKNRTGVSTLSNEELMPPFQLPVTLPLDRLVLFESLGGGDHTEIHSIELN